MSLRTGHISTAEERETPGHDSKARPLSRREARPLAASSIIAAAPAQRQRRPHTSRHPSWSQLDLHSFAAWLEKGARGGQMQRQGTCWQPVGVAWWASHLIHRASRRDCLHDICSAAIGAHWQASTDDLAQGGEVRRDIEMLLCTALGNPACTQITWGCDPCWAGEAPTLQLLGAAAHMASTCSMHHTDATSGSQAQCSPNGSQQVLTQLQLQTSTNAGACAVHVQVDVRGGWWGMVPNSAQSDEIYHL